MRPRDLTSLDTWLDAPQVRTHHSRRTAAPSDALWDAASRVRLSDTRTLGRLVRWRIPGLDPQLTYHDLFRDYPFTVLEEDDGLLLSGLCGRIWTLARDYPRLSGAEAFADWDEPGTVRVVFATVSDPVGSGIVASLARIPVVSGVSRSGSLLSYAPNTEDPFQRSGAYVDKILRGARPGDLPVQLPTKFDLIINLRTAKALGLKVPQTIIAEADERIE